MTAVQTAFSELGSKKVPCAPSLIRPAIRRDHCQMQRDDLDSHFRYKVTAAMFNDVRKSA